MMPIQEQPSHHEVVADAAPVLRVAYVLAYRAPHYIRTESLLKALRACPNVELSVARNTSTGIGRYIETWRAVRRLRRHKTPDVYVLGFRGHEFFWPLRWLSADKPLVIDALMSPFAALRDEHKGSLVRRFLAWLLYPFERSALRHADLVLTDTQLHVEFYANAFGLPAAHFCALPVGAVVPSAGSSERLAKKQDEFNVLFYGSFLPLHGIDIILDAAARLADLPIRFDFVGGSKAQITRLRRRCEDLGVTRFSHRAWVAFDQLLSMDIPAADLCLGGPFGGTPQARRVVTGKTWQCLALGKATVVGRIEEDDGFVDRINCLLVEQVDVDALAESIRWAFTHRADLPAIGARGRSLFEARSATPVIAKKLSEALQSLTLVRVDLSSPPADKRHLT